MDNIHGSVNFFCVPPAGVAQSFIAATCGPSSEIELTWAFSIGNSASIGLAHELL